MYESIWDFHGNVLAYEAYGRCGLVRLSFMNIRTVLQAQSRRQAHRKHLSKTNGRIVGTWEHRNIVMLNH